ncbi:virulence factor TspB C-terminal domain-related protein [Methylomonas sp. HYX-M1]|uniref:virulence factor TspB C-terminal domain-related protein n=1 Tax=Methylomonas sp. HYX-M1 TaxID=3139307 RepID=UPI00345BF5D1
MDIILRVVFLLLFAANANALTYPALTSSPASDGSSMNYTIDSAGKEITPIGGDLINGATAVNNADGTASYKWVQHLDEVAAGVGAAAAVTHALSYASIISSTGIASSVSAFFVSNPYGFAALAIAGVIPSIVNYFSKNGVTVNSDGTLTQSLPYVYCVNPSCSVYQGRSAADTCSNPASINYLRNLYQQQNGTSRTIGYISPATSETGCNSYITYLDGVSYWPNESSRNPWYIQLYKVVPTVAVNVPLDPSYLQPALTKSPSDPAGVVHDISNGITLGCSAGKCSKSDIDKMPVSGSPTVAIPGGNVQIPLESSNSVTPDGRVRKSKTVLDVQQTSPTSFSVSEQETVETINPDGTSSTATVSNPATPSSNFSSDTQTSTQPAFDFKNDCETNPNSLGCVDVSNLNLDDPTNQKPLDSSDLSSFDKTVNLVTDFAPANSQVGTCPAPLVVHSSLLSMDITLPWDTVCQFAVMIRPMVVSLAYLSAAFLFVVGS